jgi:hypothetical protein
MVKQDSSNVVKTLKIADCRKLVGKTKEHFVQNLLILGILKVSMVLKGPFYIVHYLFLQIFQWCAWEGLSYEW